MLLLAPFWALFATTRVDQIGDPDYCEGFWSHRMIPTGNCVLFTESAPGLSSPLIFLTPGSIIIRTVEKSECLSVTLVAEQHGQLTGVAEMRLSEDRIREAILDTDPKIRQRAVRFFAKSFSTDTSVMPLVIKAVETFGREDAYHLIGLSRDLPQAEDTIDWIIEELNDSQSDQYENYTYNLSMVLAKADATLLLPNESARAIEINPRFAVVYAERAEMTWS